MWLLLIVLVLVSILPNYEVVRSMQERRRTRARDKKDRLLSDAFYAKLNSQVDIPESDPDCVAIRQIRESRTQR